MFKILLILSIFLIYTQANCPEGTYQGITPAECFKYVSERLTFEEAEKNCQEMDAHLASIQSAFENNQIKMYLDKTVKNPVAHVWIGAQTEKEQKFETWNDKSTMFYTYWANGQPSKGKCATIMPKESRWHTNECDAKFASLCKIHIIRSHDDEL